MHNYRMVTDDLYWVGADEHRLAPFENIHPLYHGVSYNSYVLLDEKTALFDTADWAVGRQFIANVKAVLDGRPLYYMVINHVEPDCELSDLGPVQVQPSGLGLPVPAR